MFKTLRKLKPLDLFLLFAGLLFALLLIVAMALPTVTPSFADLSSQLSQPLGGFSFLLLGLYMLRNLKLPQKNLGYILLLASAFSFVVTAILLFKKLT